MQMSEAESAVAAPTVVRAAHPNPANFLALTAAAVLR
jgi:hypothetical protein